MTLQVLMTLYLGFKTVSIKTTDWQNTSAPIPSTVRTVWCLSSHSTLSHSEVIDLTNNALGALVLWVLSFCNSLGLRKADTLMVKSINKFRVNITSEQNKLQAFILSLHVLRLISKSMSTGFVLTTMMVNQPIPSVNTESMQWLGKEKNTDQKTPNCHIHKCQSSNKSPAITEKIVN